MDSLASLLHSSMRHLLRQGEMSQGKLEFAWKAAVGSAIERATTIRLSDVGTLEVSADDPTWRRELRRSQSMILGRLQELLGRDTVRAVRIVGSARERH